MKFEMDPARVMLQASLWHPCLRCLDRGSYFSWRGFKKQCVHHMREGTILTSVFISRTHEFKVGDVFAKWSIIDSGNVHHYTSYWCVGYKNTPLISESESVVQSGTQMTLPVFLAEPNPEHACFDNMSKLQWDFLNSLEVKELRRLIATEYERTKGPFAV
jgi:hypothetical protein